MKLLEYESKTILKRYGLKIPEGYLVASAGEAADTAAKIGGPVFLKAQIGWPGRGKAGGIVAARDVEEARLAASRLLGSEIKGLKVSGLLVERKLDIDTQYYLSLAIDRQARRLLILASKQGGGDIEELARMAPESILRRPIDPLIGLTEAEAGQICAWLAIPQPASSVFPGLLLSLYRAAKENDAELLELNPLVLARNGDLIAADARLIIDDNALFRHPEYSGRSASADEETPREKQARQQGLSYVDLEGDIGIIGNGAGLVMATLDLVEYFGGKPANFLDIGGGARLETIKNGVSLVLSNPAVRSVLINILGGITRCDRVAEGLVEALESSAQKKPIAVEDDGDQQVRRTRDTTAPRH